MSKFTTAVVGAAGLVGSEMIKVLIERKFPFKSLRLFATARSAGREIEAEDETIVIEDIKKSSFEGIDLALFAGGTIASKDYAHKFVEAGAIVVDNSAAFRMEPGVPLVIPEVNPQALYKHKGIIANPNCATIQMLAATKPIYDEAGIERIVMATYQSVSGTGKDAVQELKTQTEQLLKNDSSLIESKVYPHPIGFNLLPHIGCFLDNGYSSEEMKTLYETRKILEDDSIRITATTVRVPVFIGHSEAVNIETKQKITAGRVREILRSAPGVTVMDDLSENIYPYPLMAACKDDVFVGRIREDISIEKGIEMFVVSDNLRKGAALNAVQILEKLIELKLI